MELGFRGAIFDLDGTLLDSMGMWAEVDRVFLSKRGLPMDKLYLDAVKKLPHKQAAVFAVEYFKLPDTPEMVIDEWQATGGYAYDTTIELRAGVSEYLEYLHNNDVKIAAATSSLPDHAPAALKRLGVYDYFDNFTFTSEAARPKDFPDVYELAAARMGLQPHECAVFEDLLAGIRAAKSGGFISIGVYDDYYANEWDEIVASADITIKDFSELLVQKL